MLQSYGHKDAITRLYSEILEAARKEFHDDTIPGLHSYLRDCNEDAFNQEKEKFKKESNRLRFENEGLI